MKKRIGVIGMGSIAQKAYLPVVGQHDEIELVGIMSRSAASVERIGERYRIPGRYTELNQLLEQRLDAVFVHTPTETHEEVVMACLERGVHVYVDKPLSYDIQASHRMAEYALKQNRLLAVGFNRRFSPMYQQVKEMVQQHGFDLCIAQKHRTKQQLLQAKETLYDDLIHMIDLVLWLGGDEYAISAFKQEQDREGKLLHAAGHLSYGNSTALFSMNRRAGADLEKVELHGAGYSVEIVNMESAVWAQPDKGHSKQSYGSWDSVAVRRGFEGIIQHFLDSLDQPEQCSISAEQVLISHQLIERVMSSS